MKFKKIFSAVIAAAVSLAALSVTAGAEGRFTSETLKEFVLSGSGHVNVAAGDILTPDITGKVTFTEPFKLPNFNIKTKKATVLSGAYSSAVFCDGELTAMAMFSYSNDQTILHSLIYLPDDFCEKVDGGSEYTMFYTEAPSPGIEDNGSLYYAVDSEGDCVYLARDSYAVMADGDPSALKTDKGDYKRLAKYNIISKDMEKAVTTERKSESKLADGTVITLKNRDGQSLKFKGTKQFMVKSSGDGYTLSPVTQPKTRIKIGDSSKLYLRCEVGGDEPEYVVCSAKDEDKVIGTDGEGKAKVQTRDGSGGQLWIVTVK